MADIRDTLRLVKNEHAKESKGAPADPKSGPKGLAKAVTLVRREQDSDDYKYAISLAAKMQAQDEGKDKKRDQVNMLNKVAFLAVKNMAKVAVRAVVKTIARQVFKTAVRLAGRALMWIGRQIFTWVVRPLISGLITVIVANPITASIVIGGGAVAYMVWNQFFSDKGKAKRGAEVATMPESETGTDITAGGAAGVATPDQKALARGSRAERVAAAPKATEEQQKALDQNIGLIGSSPPSQPPIKPQVAKTATLVSAANKASGSTQPIGDHHIGQTSSKFESGGDPAVVSSGKGDKGGISYGTYQLASKEGSVQAYLKWSTKYGPEFKGLEVNSPAFIDKWKELGKNDRKGFGEDQHNYAATQYYDKAINYLKGKGFDLGGRGAAIQDMVWSTSVQHGWTVPPIRSALQGQNVANLSDAEIVTLVQNYKEANVETLFKSSPKLWASLRGRAATERKDLLALNERQKAKAVEDQSKTVSVAATDVKAKDPVVTDKPVVVAQNTPAANQPTGGGGGGAAKSGQPIKVGGKLVAVG